MSERNGFQAGVPCWVAAVLPDPEAGVAFYTELFGWEAADIMPPEGAERYYVCTPRGRRPPVERRPLGDRRRRRRQGRRSRRPGRGPPFNSPTGRTGILADPQGATFSLSTAPTVP